MLESPLLYRPVNRAPGWREWTNLIGQPREESSVGPERPPHPHKAFKDCYCSCFIDITVFANIY